MKKIRNRLIVLAIGISLAVLIAQAWAAVSGGAITTTVTSSTKLRLQVTTLPHQGESLYVAWFRGTASDTTFAALMDSTQTDTTLTVDQNTRYIVFLLNRRTTGQTAISDKDTVTSYPIALGDASRSGFLTRKLATAASWPLTASTMDYTFDLNGIAALDSTLVYYAKTYNGLDVYATQAGDSCVAAVYAIPINWSGTFSDGTTWFEGSAPVDSVQVTSKGLTRKSLSLPVGRYYIFRIRTHTGNGKDADYTLTLTSDGMN